MKRKRLLLKYTSFALLTIMLNSGAYGQIRSASSTNIISLSYQSTANLNKPSAQLNRIDSLDYYLPIEFTKGKKVKLLNSSKETLNDTHYFISQKIQARDAIFQVYSTHGGNTIVGEIIGNNENWHFYTTANKTWAVETKHLDIHPKKRDTVGEANLKSRYLTIDDRRNLNNQVNGVTIVDVLLLYTPNIQATYPGELTETLLNHLVGRTNQAFANSDISVQLRLVGTEFVEYTTPSNFDALDDLQAALDNNPSTQTDNSLLNLAGLRDSLGADIVSMIRTHDLDERDVCGVARFPNSDSDVLVNISNVGISGGSNCGLTFTHEIGHNFGAGHQAVDGQSQGALSNSGALIIDGKFNTIMSSIGTGDDNRLRKLNVFSNIENNCGGITCGSNELANNASTIEAFALQNANLRETAIPIGNLGTFIKTFPDNDGDNVPNTIDAFPFLSTETADTDNDGVGDEADLFPSDPLESVDNDSDGIGNNADDDDDNDGVLDINDALPFNANEANDNDSDGIGDIEDALDNNFQEYLDSDNDGIGNIADQDDDNDGVNDFHNTDSLENTNLIVVSAASNQLLEYDAQTGKFISSIITLKEGSLTFRSDIEIAPSNEIFFIAESDVYRFDRQQQRLQLGVDRSDLFANFPKHVTFIDEQQFIVTNDSFIDVLETFSLDSNGTNRTNQYGDEITIRDAIALSQNRILIVNKSANTLEIVDLNEPNDEREVFVNQQLDKPEHIASDRFGNFFVTNAGNNTITRVSSSGVAVNSFALAGNVRPSCIEVGPDNNLYVCSRDTSEVFVLDSESGNTINTLINAGSGGLSEPVSLAFVGKPLDTAPFDPTNDSDNDGTSNNNDDLPLDPNESIDTDQDGIGNNADTDDDNDGMPDEFEVDNSFDPLNSADANQDFDNDGVSNVAEFIAGTNPRVADAQPPLEPPSTPSSSGGSLGLYTLLLLVLVRGRYCLGK